MPQERRTILREKSLSDIERDYRWKTDAVLASLDATQPLCATFAEFSVTYARELQCSDPTNHTFAVDTIEGEHIGNCMYYNLSIQRGEVEIGVIIGEYSYWDKGYGTEAVISLVEHLFQKLSIHTIYLRTLEC